MYDQVHSSLCSVAPSCLDSAMERKAIDEGFVFDPQDLFPENKNYYLNKHGLVKEWSYNSETKQYEPYVSKSNG